MYKIKSKQNITKKDLKAISTNKETIALAGRNEEIIILGKTTLKPNLGFINSLKIHKYENETYIIAGSQKGTIAIYKGLDNPNVIFLDGHTQNVCSLDVYMNYLISGSWDMSVRVWDLRNMNEVFHVKLCGSAWCVNFIKEKNENSIPNFIKEKNENLIPNFIVACADKTIRLFDKEEILCVKSHLSAVRGVKMDDFIYSIGNDGKIMKNDKNGKLIKVFDCKDFLYSIDVRENKILVAGENQLILLLNEDLEVLWRGKSEGQSCWCAIFNENEILACDSNGNFFTFEEDEKKEIKNEDFIFEKKENDPILSDPNYKVENGKVYYLQNNQWSLVGDVVDDKKEFDHTFNVEVDGKYLLIQFNDGDDVYEIADKFLLKNSLSKNYRDDIVEFINKNFQPKPIFFLHKKMDIEGIKKFLKDEEIIKNLERPNKENEKIVEERLKELLKSENNFYVLDCYSYLFTKGYDFDFCFLQNYDINEKKRAMVFMRLVTNLYSKMPFNLEILNDKVRKIVDMGFLDQVMIDNFKKNKDLANK